jgi:parvulin-like peptidyl-prolyl isomerase
MPGPLAREAVSIFNDLYEILFLLIELINQSRLFFIHPRFKFFSTIAQPAGAIVARVTRLKDLSRGQKMNRKRFTKIAVLILILTSFGLGLSLINRTSSTSSATSEPSIGAAPAVLATVAGRQIPAKIYRMYLKNGVEALGLDDKTDEGRRQLALLKEGIIEELIDRALIEQEARRRGISISEEALGSAQKRRVEQMGGDDMYRAYLAEHNLADEEFRQVVTGELYGERLQEEIGKEISVIADEIKSFYEKEKTNAEFASIFKEPESVRASHILVAARRSQIAAQLQSKGNLSKAEIERLVTEETGKRRQRAALILKKAKAGADFARLSREFSEDAGTRDRGGDLGQFTRNTHTLGFDEAAFALKPDQISQIVETEYGYHIIKLREHKNERTRSLKETSSAIEQRLLAGKRARHLTQWLEGRRRDAAVVVDPFYQVGKYRADQH